MTGMPEPEGPWEQISRLLGQSEVVRRLEGLRRKLLWLALIFVVASGAAFAFTPAVLIDMQHKHEGLALVMLAPGEGFMVRVKLALALGSVAIIPSVMILLWAGATRGWPRRRRWAAGMLIPAALGLFGLGAYFAYDWVIPAALRFLIGFARQQLDPLISVASFVSFVIAVVLPFGVLFELPLVVFFLARIGLVTHRTLADRRRYAIVGIFVLAAAITPGPDVFSQLLLAIPLVVLYELSIWVAWLAAPRPLRATAAPPAAPEKSL